MRTWMVLASTLAVWSSPSLPYATEPAPDTQPAPLTLASEGGKRLVFQIGADAFGGLALGGIEFIGGVNASLLYPISHLIWAGIRPSLHYAFYENSVFETTWFHPEVAFQLNFMHEPVRLYFLGAGGYSVALDGDLYDGLAKGFSVLGGMGVAWQADGPLGLFAELGFRVGRASLDQTVLRLDDNGKPQCGAECLSWLTERVTREYQLTLLTINLGVIYAP